MQLIEITPNHHPEFEQQVLICNHEHRAIARITSKTITKNSVSFSWYIGYSYDGIWFDPTHYAVLPDYPPQKKAEEK